MLQPIAFYPNPTTGLTNKKGGKVRQEEEGFSIGPGIAIKVSFLFLADLVRLVPFTIEQRNSKSEHVSLVHDDVELGEEVDAMKVLCMVKITYYTTCSF